MSEAKKKITVEIPKELDEMIEVYAATKGMSKKDVITTALDAYLKGEIVDWSQIRGDHIIAALKLLQYLRKMDLEHEVEKTSIYLRSRFSELEYISKLVQEYEKKKREQEGEEEKGEGGSKFEELLYYMLLGLAQRLGILEFMEVE